jgi:hypothetical protein
MIGSPPLFFPSLLNLKSLKGSSLMTSHLESSVVQKSAFSTPRTHALFLLLKTPLDDIRAWSWTLEILVERRSCLLARSFYQKMMNGSKVNALPETILPVDF